MLTGTAVRRRYASLVAALLLGFAATDVMAVFVVTEPWVLAGAGAKSAEAYMELTSTEGATLVGARCEIAARVEMRAPGASRAPIQEIRLPAGKTVMLAPRGKRLALAGLDRPLELGNRVPIVLIVAAADGSRREIPVSAEVRRRSPSDDHRHGHPH